MSQNNCNLYMTINEIWPHISNIPNKINLLNNPEFMKSLLVPLSYTSLGLITIGYFYGKDGQKREKRTRRTRRTRRTI